MHYEVECKYPVTSLADLADRLAKLGAKSGEPRLQIDRYYAHPARDFATTDEALRIRSVGAANYITYKGPKIDQTTKTRREIELPLPGEESGAAGFSALLEALGFKPVAEVRKQRRKASIPWQGREVEVCLDEVDRVGTFLELELTVDEAEVNAARNVLTELARHLGLGVSERRSYLELLLEQTNGSE